MKNKKTTLYLAGGMENSPGMGSEWRKALTRYILEKHDVEILNPCEFEPDQLKGLQPNRLPTQMETRSGKNMDPEHWHEMKLAPRDSCHYKRCIKYMHKIQDYDIGLIQDVVDYLIVNWTKGTGAGGGTHEEIYEAYKVKKRHVPIYIVENHDIPLWIEAKATEIFPDFYELRKFLDEELGE